MTAIGDDVVLEVSGLGKKFCRDLRRSLSYGARDVAREVLGRPPHGETLRQGEFWALDDIGFELRRGEALAVLGHNGAGKSTLLRLLYGLLKPDAGEIRVRGSTSAIIELGTGFNPLLTGRENVEIAAALHDHPAREIPELLAEVVEFAELEEFIDAPVQSYSSGMTGRLAYSLSAHLRPDLLLVDEALAVGDIVFQRKCLSHMRRYIADGGALIFVSHNIFQSQAICERGLVLADGRLAFTGTAVEAVDQLFRSGLAEPERSPAGVPATGPAAIEELTAEPGADGPIASGGPLRLTLRYRSTERVEARWAFSVWTADQWVCITGDLSPETYVLEAPEGALTCLLPSLPLVGGRYWLRAVLADPETAAPLAMWGWESAPTLLVVDSAGSAGDNLKMSVGQLTLVDVEWR